MTGPRITRRRLLIGATGLTTAALLGCGDDDDAPASPAPTEGTVELPTPTARPTRTPTPDTAEPLFPGGFARSLIVSEGYGDPRHDLIRLPIEPGQVLTVRESPDDGRLVFINPDSGGGELFYANAGNSFTIAGAGNRFLAVPFGPLLVDRMLQRRIKWDGRAAQFLAASDDAAVFAEGTPVDFSGRLHRVRFTGDQIVDDGVIEAPRDVFVPFRGWLSPEGDSLLAYQRPASDPVNEELRAFSFDESSWHSVSPRTSAAPWAVLSSGLELVTGTWPVHDPQPKADPPVRGATIGDLLPEDRTTTIRRIDWDGVTTHEETVTGPMAYLSPDGRYVAHDHALWRAYRPGLGPADEFDTVAIRDLQAQRDVARVNGATLRYGDQLIGNRWLADSSGLILRHADERGARMAYSVLRLDGLTLSPVPATTFNGPIPSPVEPDLYTVDRGLLHSFARGPLPSVEFDPDPRSQAVFGHVPPWLGDGSEVVLQLGHGGHGLSGAPLTLRPVVQPAPFSADPVLRVDAPSGCQPLLDAPEGGESTGSCAQHDAIVNIALPTRSIYGEFRPTFTSEDGLLLHVTTETGQSGWLPAANLRFA